MRFERYCQLGDEGHDLDLLTGALLIAADAYPGLDTQAVGAELAALARPLRLAGATELDPALRAERVSRHLFMDLGFRGNVADYYDPRNSYLNQVLERRLGIPISLSVLWLLVARELGLRAHGVGFPGHFLVRVEADRPLVLDPFHQGKVLSREDLAELAAQVPGLGAFEERLLAPVDTRSILIRMLNNLRIIHARRGDHARQLLALDRILTLDPSRAGELSERGLLQARLGAPEAARADLERYLELMPRAPNRAAVERVLQRLERGARSVN